MILNNPDLRKYLKVLQEHQKYLEQQANDSSMASSDDFMSDALSQ